MTAAYIAQTHPKFKSLYINSITRAAEREADPELATACLPRPPLSEHTSHDVSKLARMISTENAPRCYEHQRGTDIGTVGGICAGITGRTGGKSPTKVDRQVDHESGKSGGHRRGGNILPLREEVLPPRREDVIPPPEDHTTSTPVDSCQQDDAASIEEVGASDKARTEGREYRTRSRKGTPPIGEQEPAWASGGPADRGRGWGCDAVLSNDSDFLVMDVPG